ncbi:hypothetical protein EKO04_010651 [Ascochyta lentis]|uniref:PPM-type phosphatase domain-containing protein n=1 Tax=Ascochyta lentis TaxID=205686 RepID=A0A8H7MFH2_9PLEO|nr:hypothetical protein EKO04_010651 [Ascochyta lentis]
MTNMMHRIRRSLDRGRGAGVSSTDTNAVQITDVGTSVIQGARPHQEDRFIALQPGSFKSNQDIALFAVFDGHAGANVAEHSRKTLADYIDATLSKTTPHSQETYKAAIQEALDQEDKDADREGWDDGSTLALVLIDTAQKILVEADIGDSHVMLAEHTRRNKKDQNKLNKLDHTLRAHHLAKVEKKRIEDAGGEVKYDTGTPRVGALAMSRSMGDLDLKLPRVNRLAGHNLTDLDGVETGLKPGRKASADLVINKAHFNVRNLGGESLLFLCSDGIGEARDAEVATQQATRWKSEGRPAKQIAADMASRAGKVKNSDNVTVLVVCLETSIDAQ